MLSVVVTGAVSYSSELLHWIIYMHRRELRPVCNKTQNRESKKWLNVLLQGKEVEQRGGMGWDAVQLLYIHIYQPIDELMLRSTCLRAT